MPSLWGFEQNSSLAQLTGKVWSENSSSMRDFKVWYIHTPAVNVLKIEGKSYDVPDCT